tara:strand:+ start:1269 stop:2009 length:741 start_codon:yes stop_codon:yes gene_type:complete
MTIKIREFYSPNFDKRPRKRKFIKYLIFHYTGMKSENAAIKRLTKIQSEVSTHYFVKKSGEVLRMVPDLYIAWHAGVSQWRKHKLLNKNSIGIEISNPGHQNGYIPFSKKQIKSTIKLSKILIKKYKIKNYDILGHSDIAPERKKDPGEKFPWKILYKNKIGIWHNLSKNKLSPLRRISVSSKQIKSCITSLKKLGYPKSSIVYKKKRYETLLIKAFQRRFRPELIDGKIDQECLAILNKIKSFRQ